MMTRMRLLRWLALSVLCLPYLQALLVSEARAATWAIPVAGNAFPAQSASEGKRSRLFRDGALRWSDPDQAFSIFFHVDRAARLQLALKARGSDGDSRLRITAKHHSFLAKLAQGGEWIEQPLGSIQLPQPGYLEVRVQGIDRTGSSFAEVRDLIVSSASESLKLTYVESNAGNMFYWGRRGPSVHLRYSVPEQATLQYAYSELTVPVGEDPIGSFYMANGFREGYFGMQVNSPKERRVLFSIWSPYKTDDPRQIPKDQRIEALARGPGVHIGEFGNEGSGGQSYLRYPWQAGKTYRFLTEIRPEANDKTRYTAWFSEVPASSSTADTPAWRLIASFRRPKTQTHLRGFHSFLESFAPTLGHIGRRVAIGNVWVRDTGNQWHECTQARFSVDATGGGGHRLDFAGGATGNQFFLRNCGFFSPPSQAGARFVRDRNGSPPTIAIEALPMD